MGGQATLFDSSYQNASKYNLKAAVMHHPYSHELPNPTIPFAFTEHWIILHIQLGVQLYLMMQQILGHRGLINKYEVNSSRANKSISIVDVARYTLFLNCIWKNC